MNQNVFIAGFVTLAGLFLLIVSWYFVYSRQQAALFLNRLRFGTSRVNPEFIEESHPSPKPSLKLLRLVEAIGLAAKPKKESELSDIRRRLIVAGYRHPKAPILFWGTRLLLCACLIAASYFLPIGAHAGLDPFDIQLLLIVLGAIVGLYLPDLWIRFQTQRRQREIREGFPDVLDLMVVCVEAGLSLDQAIGRVSQEIRRSYPIISEEFVLLTMELRLGIPREEALRNFNNRIMLEEIQQLTALIIQADKFGSSVTKALRVYSDSMRKKRFFRAEEIAAKLPVKLTFPLIFFIFPSIFIVLLGPAVILMTEVVFPALRGN